MTRVKAWYRLMKRRWAKPQRAVLGASSIDFEITDFDHRPLIPWLTDENK